MLKIKRMNYSEFFESTWDYVSEQVVTDDIWNKHRVALTEITFDIYNLREKSSQEIAAVGVITTLTPKVAARIIESFIKKLNIK